MSKKNVIDIKTKKRIKGKPPTNAEELADLLTEPYILVTGDEDNFVFIHNIRKQRDLICFLEDALDRLIDDA